MAKVRVTVVEKAEYEFEAEFDDPDDAWDPAKYPLGLTEMYDPMEPVEILDRWIDNVEVIP